VEVAGSNGPALATTLRTRARMSAIGPASSVARAVGITPLGVFSPGRCRVGDTPNGTSEKVPISACREARSPQLVTLPRYPAAGLCLRKPSLIACRTPSSIKVLAASGTLVPWVPSLDSWSKYSQVARASVIGRRSVSAMPDCTMACPGIRVLFDSKKSRNRFTFR